MTQTKLTLIWLLTSWLTIFSSAALADAPEMTGGDQVVGDHVKVTWLAPERFSRDQPTTIGLYFEVDPHWHVYWQNPGDSGAAPRFDFTANAAEVGPPQWPAPSRLPIEHLTNLAYPGNVAYLFEITPAAKASTQHLSLTVDLEWLVCKIDCIPGFGQMQLERPFGKASEWSDKTLTVLQSYAAKIPQPWSDAPWANATVQNMQEQNILQLTLSPATPDVPEIYPVQGSVINAAKPEVDSKDNSLTFRFKTLPGTTIPQTTSFVVVDKDEKAWALNEIPIQAGQVAVPLAPQAVPLSSLTLLVFALLGGVILNLMPCVFPVLSIKIMHLCDPNTPTQDRLSQGLFYSAGVLTTFAALGLAFLLLRASGLAVGWGFQLQSPVIVVMLIVLFWFMGLSFLGAITFGNRITQLAGRVQSGSSFVTGVLAVFVAAPCTGPFMGAALGASTVLSSVMAMTIFLALGTGLALPFLILSASPHLAKKLPKPGEWMEHLKQFLAFPLFATAIWLTWVLSKLVGESGWLLSLSLMFITAFFAWSLHLNNRGVRHSAFIFSVIATSYIFSHWPTNEVSPTEQTSGHWQHYDESKITQAQNTEQSILVDFTAAWCITCQLNKQIALDTDAAKSLYEQYQIVTLRADWTRYDETITQALNQFGRNSVPLYVFYPANGSEAVILPQILSVEILKDTFAQYDDSQKALSNGGQTL